MPSRGTGPSTSHSAPRLCASAEALKVIEALREEHDHNGNCNACDRGCEDGDDLWFLNHELLKTYDQKEGKR